MARLDRNRGRSLLDCILYYLLLTHATAESMIFHQVLKATLTVRRERGHGYQIKGFPGFYLKKRSISAFVLSRAADPEDEPRFTISSKMVPSLLNAEIHPRLPCGVATWSLEWLKKSNLQTFTLASHLLKYHV